MKKSFVILALSSFLFLASCNSPHKKINKFTVKFLNADGNVLQTKEFDEGTLPVYEGETPTLAAPTQHENVYTGWDKPIVKVKEDTTYTATYDLVFLFGTYPQTLVSDSELIEHIQKEGTQSRLDYVKYNDTEYASYTSEQDYIADDGTRVKEGKTNYYEVKNIQWKILGDESNKFYTTYKLLDTCNFNNEFETETAPFPNNYYQSEMRKYLNSTEDYVNDGFKWRAFKDEDLSKIKQPKIDNSDESTCDPDNPYNCDDIAEGNDYVFALSRQELRDNKLGFISVDNIDKARCAKSTDYARARDATLYNDNTSTYWTRSPSASELGPYKYNAYNVLCDGAIVFNATDFIGRCIRPAIILN